jgi:hypothetical protein
MDDDGAAVRINQVCDREAIRAEPRICGAIAVNQQYGEIAGMIPVGMHSQIEVAAGRDLTESASAA